MTSTVRRIVICLLMVQLGGTAALADIREDPLPVQLQRKGVDTTNATAVANAAKTGDPVLRILAIRYQASENVDIVPYLTDPDFDVRVRVADLLASTGKKNGLQVMAEDFDFFTKNGMARDAQTFLALRNKVTGDRTLVQALDAATVLAKMGDFRGQTLAEMTLANAPLEAQRYRAVEVMENIISVSRTAKDRAVKSLEDAARKDESSIVVQMIIAAMLRDGGTEAAQILTKVLDSKVIDDNLKEQVNLVIQQIVKVNQAQTAPVTPLPGGR